MRILLACALGCTTGMMVQKMKAAAQADDVIEAHSINEMAKVAKDFDCVLLGPQVRVQADSVRKICDPLGIPVDFIDPRAYGRMDGKAVYQQATKLIKGE